MFLNNILGRVGAIKELRGFKATFFVDVYYGNTGCGVYKIRKISAQESTYSKEIIEF